eukprot:COSAG02_NODE_37342_length_443_cov_0.744186_1_plen_50_part_10
MGRHLLPGRRRDWPRCVLWWILQLCDRWAVLDDAVVRVNQGIDVGRDILR